MPKPSPALIARRQEIGDHIRQHRRWANLTQGEVISRSGLDHRTFQRIERGETDARLSWLMRIADAIGIPLAQLVDKPKLPR